MAGRDGMGWNGMVWHDQGCDGRSQDNVMYDLTIMSYGTLSLLRAWRERMRQ